MANKGYAPLWKQWMQSKEGKDYIKNEAPKAKAIMSETLKQLADEKAERDRIRERDLQMAKEYHLRYVDQADGKVKESKHNSEKSAKDRARDLSMTNSPVQVGEVDGGKLLQQWNFDKGRQQAMNTKKQVSVAPISKKEASQIQTNEKGTSDMATKSKKYGAAKASKAKVSKVAPKGKAAAAPKAVKKTTGPVRDLFELREGSNKEKLVDALLAAKGKPLGVSALLKATYGSAKDDNKGALMMVMKGVPAVIAKNKIKMELIKDKSGEEMTFALKAK